MQRRSVGLVEVTTESVGSSSQGTIPSRQVSKSNRKSITLGITNRSLHDETRSKFFPMIVVLMEFCYYFVAGSTEVYSIYSLAGFTTSLKQMDAMDTMVKYRYIGALAVLPIGVLCDSYIGTIFPLLVALFLLTGFTGLHAFISIPWMFLSSGTKIVLAHLTFPMFTIFYVLEPVKLATVSRAILGSNYFRQQRHFYALWVCAMNLGLAFGGTATYYSGGSRYALCTTMFANFALMLLYFTFHLVTRRHLMNGNLPSKSIDRWGVVEKAVIAIVCRTLKSFDKHVLRKTIFGGSSDIAGDYRCIHFSQNTRKNAKAMVGIILVTVPLVAAFTMFVITHVLYYVQLSMFYYYPSDPFPLLALKSYIFLLLFPLMEFYLAPALKKWSASVSSRQLVMIGLGAICASFSLCWSFGIHKKVTDGNEFWYQFPKGEGHVAITNCLQEPVLIRSQFMNSIVDNDDGWTTLPPFKTVTLLNILVHKHKKIHFEFSNTKLAMYDEYFLPISEGEPTWYVILPTGVYPFPPGCYRRSLRHIVLSTSYYGPGQACVVCAMTICNGHVQFRGLGRRTAPLVQVPIVPLTGRGQNESLDHKKIEAKLVGKYKISSTVGGVDNISRYTVKKFDYSYTYMIVVYENAEDDRQSASQTANTAQDENSVELKVMKTSPRYTYHEEWMYPAVAFHALAEDLYVVSLWMFLFSQSPDQIQTTVFSLVNILCLPAYTFLFHYRVLVLRRLPPLAYFYLAVINCFFMIVYFFCLLLFIHKLFKGKSSHRSSVEQVKENRQSVISEQPEEQKGE